MDFLDCADYEIMGKQSLKPSFRKMKLRPKRASNHEIIVGALALFAPSGPIADRSAATSVSHARAVLVGRRMDPARCRPGQGCSWWAAWIKWRQERRSQRPWDADGWDTEGPGASDASTLPPVGDYSSAFRTPKRERDWSRSRGSD